MIVCDVVDLCDVLCDVFVVLFDFVIVIGQDVVQCEVCCELLFDGFVFFWCLVLGVLWILVVCGGLGGMLVDLFDVIVMLVVVDLNFVYVLCIYYDQIEMLWLLLCMVFNDVQFECVLVGVIFGGVLIECGMLCLGENMIVLCCDGDYYCVMGCKYYLMGIVFVDFVCINVENEQGDVFVVIVLVVCDGLQVFDDWDGMGQCMIVSGSLVLNDVQVFVDEVVLCDGLMFVGWYCGVLWQLYLVVIGVGIVCNVVVDVCCYVFVYGCFVLYSLVVIVCDDYFIQQIVGELFVYSYVIDVFV